MRLSVLLAFIMAFVFTRLAVAQHPKRHVDTRLLSGEQITAGPVAEMGPVLSPDNRWVAFEYFNPDYGGNPQIWVMPSDGNFSSAYPLVNDGEYHAGISWSPDSKWVSFVTAISGVKQKLLGATSASLISCQVYKIQIETREITQVTELPPETSLGDDTAWSRDGLIAFQKDGDIYAVRQEGGPDFKVLDLNARGLKIGNPACITWSPDAQRIVFGAVKNGSGRQVASIWIADVREERIEEQTIAQTVGAVSWINNSTLLITRVDKEGGARLFSFALRTHKSHLLTDGPLEMSGSLDLTHHILFFDHGTNADTKFDDWVPRLHIWKKSLPPDFSGWSTLNALTRRWFVRRSQ